MCQVLQDTEVFVLAGFEFRSFISFNDATSLSLKQKRKHPAAATWGEACWAQAHGAFHIDQKGHQSQLQQRCKGGGSVW